MKKFVAILLAAMMLLTAMTAIAEEENTMNWAYGAMPLNNGNVGTIYYTAAYYELEGIVNPTNPEYAPYTAEEIAVIGVGVADSDVIFWYDAENAAAIVGHADPLTLDAETGNFVTAEGTAVASPIK